MTDFMIFEDFISKYEGTYIEWDENSFTRIKNTTRFVPFDIYVRDDLVHSFVPCYRKSDGEIGMYDTVSQTFFTNAGTGTLLKGADV